jgi:DNA/RNA endonuclease YhcR with UshA esterase domain
MFRTATRGGCIAAISCSALWSICGLATLAADAPGDAKPPAVIDAADKSAIEAAMPHDVTVVGTISDIKPTESVTSLNFKGTEKSQFYAVVLQRNREAVEKVHGEGLKSLAGKSIKVSGKLVEYRDKPEIVVSSPDQIVAIGEALPAGAVREDAPKRSAPIDATDKSAIDAAMPREVSVTGTIDSVKVNQGTTAIDFRGTEKSEFYAVVLGRNRDDVEKTFGEGLKSLVGKTVAVTGKIAEYRDRPQIVVSRPEQIKVIDK